MRCRAQFCSTLYVHVYTTSGEQCQQRILATTQWWGNTGGAAASVSMPEAYVRGSSVVAGARHDLDGFDADAGDLADEADDVLFIVGVVGVAGDAAGRRGDSPCTDAVETQSDRRR